MTEEDIRRIVGEKLQEVLDSRKAKSQHDPRDVEQRLKEYYARYAFEEAWRLAGGDPVVSSPDAEPIGWRKAWMESDVRKRMIKAGLVSGEDNYK